MNLPESVFGALECSAEPMRALAFEGVHNFRDLGGYRGVEGRAVRWGFLFRSAHLSAMTGRDKASFEQLGIELICDFRRADERLRQPTQLEALPLEIVHLEMDHGSVEEFWNQVVSDVSSGRFTQEDMVSLMEGLNRDLVTKQSVIYRNLFQELLRRQQRVLMHCTAGKDRTGLACALLLTALGVDRPTIFQDYLLTQHHYPVENELRRRVAGFVRSGHPAPDATVLRPIFEVRESYLQAALREIESRFGDIGVYMEDRLGLDARALAQLRHWYLADAQSQGAL